MRDGVHAGVVAPAVAVAILVVALVLLSGLRPAWGGRLVRPFLRRRGIDVPALVRGRALTLAVALNTAGWAATATGIRLLLGGIAKPAPDTAWLASAYARSRGCSGS
jgi:hypothetical protein